MFETEASWKTWKNLPVKLQKPGILFVGRFLNIHSICLMLIRLFMFFNSNTDHLRILKANFGVFLGICPLCLNFYNF